jgi:hypothetical protein
MGRIFRRNLRMARLVWIAAESLIPPVVRIAGGFAERRLQRTSPPTSKAGRGPKLPNVHGAARRRSISHISRAASP